MDATKLLTQSIDKSQVPPLQKKRILAFVNHFLISSCSFLNEFSTNCETKFIELERKLQRIEAALIILEEKLASVPDLTENVKTLNITANETTTVKDSTNIETATKNNNVETAQQETEHLAGSGDVVESPVPIGVRACDDVRYKKYFKMLQFGVPVNAVKLKMLAEGHNADIIDNPTLLLPDGKSCE
ncbi:WASH complex subunit 3 [Teleopsis dalmanni]|uniref:WASH complex subunit 3 n=1 Tax=Teleopsis dalmanni TaxID=139649 RepID=UPI0018CCEC77|nr:WASH complex subunit 3 [Teleopsis dalmanni]